MSEIDVGAFERRYTQLQKDLGGYNVGEAVRLLAQLPVTDERWDHVFNAEFERCLKLYEEHYAEYDRPVTIAIGGGKIWSSRELAMVTIGFVQGATFVVASLREQGLIE